MRKAQPLSLQLALPIEAVPAELDREHGNEIIVATWNVNSVRAHIELIEAWLKRTGPDLVCLQETKVIDALFPFEVFSQLGYHVVVRGQGAHNGVAILSRFPLHSVTIDIGSGAANDEARVIAACIGDVRVVCVYAPNAYSVSAESFQRKLAWLRDLSSYLRGQRDLYRCLLVCGDFNVTPGDADLHDSSLWIYKTFVHPDARRALSDLSEGLVDLHRRMNGDSRGFTWWDYRKDALAQNHGIRIDHVYTSEALAANCVEVHVDQEARRATKPSDHAPVVGRFNLTEDWLARDGL